MYWCWQAVIWFLARWVATYLVPLDVSRGQVSRGEIDSIGTNGSQHSRKLLNSFAWENNQGELVLDFVVLISMLALTAYQGENELQVSFAFTYLYGFVQSTCPYMLVHAYFAMHTEQNIISPSSTTFWFFYFMISGMEALLFYHTMWLIQNIKYWHIV